MLRRCSRHQTGWKYEQYAVPEPRYTYLFDWDPLDRMRWHNGPGINRVLAYTADGERIVERNLTSGVTTISLRGLDAKVLREVKLENGSYSWQKDYIYREGQLLASHGNNEPLQHYHLDHLGTPRMLSNRCGERLQRFENFPFGEAIAELPQHPEKMRLTGHQRDLNQPTTTEDDLDYMHARYYGTKMGRFVSVDPASRSIGAERPQSWNRYSYVHNSPIILADPDGEAGGAVLALPFALGGTSGVAAGSALLATGVYGGVGVAVLYLVAAHAEPLSLAEIERIQAASCHTNPVEAQQGSDNPAKVVSSHQSSASGETTTPPPPPADPGGGRTGRKVSRDQRENAERRIDEARQRWRDADSKPNKTPEDKAEVERLRRELDRLIDKRKASEEHARRAQHS